MTPLMRALKRLAVTEATGREATVLDAAALTVLAGAPASKVRAAAHAVNRAPLPAKVTGFMTALDAVLGRVLAAKAPVHPIFGDTSEMTAADADDVARTFMRIHD